MCLLALGCLRYMQPALLFLFTYLCTISLVFWIFFFYFITVLVYSSSQSSVIWVLTLSLASRRTPGRLLVPVGHPILLLPVLVPSWSAWAAVRRTIGGWLIHNRNFSPLLKAGSQIRVQALQGSDEGLLWGCQWLLLSAQGRRGRGALWGYVSMSSIPRTPLS